MTENLGHMDFRSPKSDRELNLDLGGVVIYNTLVEGKVETNVIWNSSLVSGGGIEKVHGKHFPRNTHG